MNVKLYLERKINGIIFKQWPELRGRRVNFAVEWPVESKYGDYSTNVAMKLAPFLHRPPVEIAEDINSALGRLLPFEKKEVVPPGFINFFLSSAWLSRQTKEIIKAGKNYGKSKHLKKQKIQVEFISANPTGPLHLGNGRGGFLGDVLANVLKLAGHRVQKEYYINDVGKQTGILAESVLRKYWRQKGIRIDYPNHCYQGKYIDDLARKIFLPNYKLNSLEKLEKVKEKIKGRILKQMVSEIKKVTERKLGIKFDRWYEEHTLYSSGIVDNLLKELKGRQLLYKKEGAIWLKTSQFGDDKDRVVIKADGEPVYFLSDIAYHWEKFTKRKFDRVIDILGADHHGYIGRLQAVMDIFKFNSCLDIIIVQLVRLLKRGREVKMSKRSGTYVTLEELVDEVGIDAVRFFFLMRDFTTHMDFDFDLAKKKSQENPVFYVQYAHARICSIIRRSKNLKIKQSDKRAIIDKSEKDLIKTMLRWPELVVEVAENYEVNKLPTYAVELATRFHEFYTKCRVVNGRQVNKRRLGIIKAVRSVLRNIMSTMGISTPERM